MRCGFCSVSGCEGASNNCCKTCPDSRYNEIRSEAIREFAKKIKNIYSVHDGLHSTINTLVKEMINGT